MRPWMVIPCHILLLSFALRILAQTATDYPQCWHACLVTNKINCQDADFDCVCQSTTSLSTLITCVTTSCPSPPVLVAPLQLACPVLSSTQLPGAHSAFTVERPTLLLASPASLTVVSTRTATGNHATTTATATATATAKAKQGGGTLLDLSNVGARRQTGSLLGLTVGLLAGIAWF